MIDHFRMFAHYNRWANETLHGAVARLSDAEFRADKGAFFGSLHGTLNHLLVTDGIWLARFTGKPSTTTSLRQIAHEDFSDLRAARQAQDAALIDWIHRLTPDDLQKTISYTPLSIPEPIVHPLAPALAHLFNHQTHHRGQCHTILTTLGKPSLSLDLIYFLRSDGRQWMASTQPI